MYFSSSEDFALSGGIEVSAFLSPPPIASLAPPKVAARVAIASYISLASAFETPSFPIFLFSIPSSCISSSSPPLRKTSSPSGHLRRITYPVSADLLAEDWEVNNTHFETGSWWIGVVEVVCIRQWLGVVVRQTDWCRAPSRGSEF